MRKIVWVIVLLVLFLFFHLLIEYFVLSSIAKIKIIAEPDRDTHLTVYYSNGIAGHPFSEKKSIKSHKFKEGVKTNLTISLKNRIGRNLRIDPLSGEGIIKIYSIKVLSHFGDPIVFTPERIFQYFQHDSTSSVVLHNDFVEITSKGPDPQLTLTHPLRFSNPLFGYILPLFLSVLFALVLKNISFKSIYAVRDITSKKPSMNKNIIALDGLRGFAAILVLADHTGLAYTKGIGATGVWIFFCLSGFLLSIPFVKNPALIKSPAYLEHYMLRRIKRIVPMYYFILIVLYLLRGRLEGFIRHATFIQGDGIYWSVPQEMFFYMILPFVLVLNYYLCRGNTKIMIFLTLTFAVISNQYLNTDYVYIYGNGSKMALLAGIFLSGVCLSYFYHSSYITFLQQRSKLFLNVCGLLLLGIVLLSSDTILDQVFRKQIHYTWVYTDIFGYIAALLLLFSIIYEGSILNKIMSFYPLRAIGIVGFSFYLLHPNVLEMIKSIFLILTGQNINNLLLFVSGVIVTYLFAALTYSLIERPFLVKT